MKMNEINGKVIIIYLFDENNVIPLNFHQQQGVIASSPVDWMGDTHASVWEVSPYYSFH